MMDTVDPQIVDALNQSQTATMTDQVVLTSGAGKAYQAVVQSAALAVQDAVDALRGATATATVASGIALAQFIETADPRYLEALAQAQSMVDKAIRDFSAVSAAAAAIVRDFPRG